jgi:hypothetical protein
MATTPGGRRARGPEGRYHGRTTSQGWTGLATVTKGQQETTSEQAKYEKALLDEVAPLAFAT